MIVLSPRTLRLFSARGVALAALLGGCASSTTQGPREATAQEVRDMRQTMAESLVAQRYYDQALPYLKELVTRTPRQPRVHLLLGIVLREKGMLAPAEVELRQALALAPQSAAVHAALGNLYSRQRRLLQAERSHRQAVKLAPGEAQYHNDLGFCLILERRFADARAVLLEAIRLDPGLRRAYNNLGLAHGLEGDLEAALKAFSQAGSRAMALTNLGFIEEMRGRPMSARRYYERALQTQAGYGPALKNLRALERSAAAPPAEQPERPREEEMEL
ncbi:MAG: tetratricopeptide repeat protein [Deltaproteobacteria bacterium]|nr:tetratricopeptide repeat protein [Deltaproteobacteria bacterium]